MSDMLLAARGYVPRALPLEGKRPLLPAWPDVVATPELVDEWWRIWPRANVGILTGKRLVVIDVDPRHGGDQALADLEQRHGPLPATPEVATGGGGRHIYFRGPTVLPSRDLGPGLEVKADGRQVVAPPSIHPESGRTYTWQPGRPFDPRAIAALPDWLRPGAEPPRSAVAAAADRDDWLKTIPAGQYVPELTARPITHHGYICCPFHSEGQERTPSLLAGGREAHLWKCFACGAGGSIYDLAARLAGYQLPLRGAAFLTVRDGLYDHYEAKLEAAA